MPSMLGVRLSPEEEERLARYARESGRPKSALARDWIIQALDRESVDRKIAKAAALHAEASENSEGQRLHDLSIGWIRALDAEDGGYDWGQAGPPDLG
jgi:predicted transcriptional regulator